jgi:DNA repair protein RecN (Recombination protein N)
MDQIKMAIHKARQLVSIDESFQEVLSGLERAAVELEEVMSASKDYIGRDNLDPNRLEGVQSRLSLITQLKRKYGQSVEEILAAQKKLEDEQELLSNLSSRVEVIEKELSVSLKETSKLGKELFERRKKAAQLFSKSIESELKGLKMSGVSSVSFSKMLSRVRPVTYSITRYGRPSWRLISKILGNDGCGNRAK